MARPACAAITASSARSLAAVAPIDGLETGQAGVGQLPHGALELSRRQAQGQWMGQDGQSARLEGQLDGGHGLQAFLFQIGRAPLGQVAVEGVLDRD